MLSFSMKPVSMIAMIAYHKLCQNQPKTAKNSQKVAKMEKTPYFQMFLPDYAAIILTFYVCLIMSLNRNHTHDTPK